MAPFAVELRDVTFRYPGATRDALRGVSLRVAAGETVALVGPTGAGKSTVARLLVRDADPDEGTVLLDGVDVRDVRQDALREHVALLRPEGRGVGEPRAPHERAWRLEIAQALMHDRPVVVVDDRTRGIDEDVRESVLAGVDALRSGRTALLISHDPAIVARADRVVGLREGWLVGEGAPA